MDENSAVQTQSAPRKSRWRISLRTAFILLTLACFALVYIARAEKQRRIVAQLEKWGYRCEFTDRLHDKLVWSGWKTDVDRHDPFGDINRRAAKRGVLGHYIENVQAVHSTKLFDVEPHDDPPRGFSLEPISQLPGLKSLSLRMRGLRDEDLKPLASMHTLRSLALDLPYVNDAGLVHIRPLTQLTHLTLRCRITDAGLKQLSPLTNLRSLSLYDSEITDIGLSELPQHPHLEDVSVAYSKGISGSGMIHFVKLPRLHSLNLSGTSISDECLAQLDKIPTLEWIDLAQCPIGDSGVAHLAQCKNVYFLVLDGTKITDRGVVELTKMPRLNNLFLDVAGVTDQGVLSLKRADALYVAHFSEGTISQEVRAEMSDFLSARMNTAAEAAK